MPDENLNFESRPSFQETLGKEKNPKVRRFMRGFIVAGLFLAVGGAFAAFIFVYMVPLNKDLGTRLDFGQNKALYYSDKVTKDDAQRLGDVCKQAGVFTAEQPADVHVTKEGDAFVVSFFVAEGTWDDAAVVKKYTELRRQLGKDALAGKTITVQLCPAKDGAAQTPITAKKVIND